MTLCTRCGVQPAGRPRKDAKPGTEHLCYDCRYELRHPTAGLRRTRCRTLSMKRQSKRALEAGAREYPQEESESYERPRTRGDCLPGGCNAERPCPFVSCKYHLYLDVSTSKGSIKLNFPTTEIEDMEHTCALDLADAGEHTLEDVASVMNLTRERIRQLEDKSIARVLLSPEARQLREDLRGYESHCEAATPLPYSLGGISVAVSAYQREEREQLYALGWGLVGTSAGIRGNVLYWHHPFWGNALSVEQALKVTAQHSVGASRAA